MRHFCSQDIETYWAIPRVLREDICRSCTRCSSLGDGNLRGMLILVARRVQVTLYIVATQLVQGVMAKQEWRLC